MKTPVFKCPKCKQLQGYQGKSKPHCGMCETPLNEKDIIDYIEVVFNLTDFYYEYNGTWEEPEDTGCCLLCPEEKKEENEYDDGYSDAYCLCFNCNCTKCEAYESNGDGGYCTHASEFKRINEFLNKYSHKIINITKETDKAIYGTIELSTDVFGHQPKYRTLWIPKKMINDKKQVKNWFLNTKKLLCYEDA